MPTTSGPRTDHVRTHTITTTVVTVSAAVLVGCSGTPTSAVSTPSNSGNSDTTEHGAPKVTQPLDYARFEANPCGILAAPQLQTLGLSGIVGEDTTGTAAKSCAWNDSRGVSGQTLFVAFPPGGGGLDHLYQIRDSFAFFEPQPPIQGYPVILNAPTNDREPGGCAMDIGITDTQVASLGVHITSDAPRYGDPCGVVTEFANQVMTTLTGRL